MKLVDEIARGVVKSKTALWIICPEFFQDKTCEIAAHFALNELGVRNNLLVILENRLERYKIPKQFATLMNPNLGIHRVRYTNNEDGQELFWAKLDTFIPAWLCQNID